MHAKWQEDAKRSIDLPDIPSGRCRGTASGTGAWADGRNNHPVPGPDEYRDVRFDIGVADCSPGKPSVGVHYGDSVTSPVNAFDPLVMLATGLHAKPGVYAVLLGSGVSTGADIPTG